MLQTGAIITAKYPKIHRSVRKIKTDPQLERPDRLDVMLESWVKVKRNGKFYYVKVLDEMVTRPEDINTVLNFIESFHNKCLATIYMWQKPERDIVFERFGYPSFEETSNHLNMKEEFLLNYPTGVF